MRFSFLSLGLCLACSPTLGSGGAGAVDAGLRPSASDDSGPASMSDAAVCADVRVETRRVTPSVTVIVDQSLSMEDELGGGVSRWDAVRRALTDDGGLVTELEGSVEFGLALYSDTQGGSAACPALTTVDNALGNRVAIDDAYRGAAPLGETPTGDAIDALLAALPAPGDDPRVFVLATDGNPDRCGAPDDHGETSRRRSVAAVERAHAAGVRTYAIGVGLGTVAADHLRELARAGSGGASEAYWEVGDTAGLRGALESIVRGEITCTLELMGRVDPAAACSGTVTLDGAPLACDAPDGWRLVDERHLELLGAACDDLLSRDGVVVEASFPCEALLI